MFSSNNLPKLKTGTSGRALPKPGSQLVACEITIPVTMTPWGSPIHIEPGKGYWHCVLEVNDTGADAYPNNEFGAFYEIKGDADPCDPRTRWLIDYWIERGQTVHPVVAEKTKSAIVAGILDEDGIFQTKESPAPFKVGDVLLESPTNHGQMWPVAAAVFEKKYQGIVPTDNQHMHEVFGGLAPRAASGFEPLP